MSELRWHPLLGQWVVVTAQRQHRPQMPKDWCPFCPGSGLVPEEYDVWLYPNDFPAFSFENPNAFGACDVVLYSTEHDRLPSQLPLEQWEKIVRLWTRRTKELLSDSRVKYVAVFENTGEAVGVTMPHPHGQIYALPFVPPRIEQEWNSSSKFRLEERGCLYCDVLNREVKEGVRIIAENEMFIAYNPYFARFPYESHVALRRHAATLPDLTDPELDALAAIVLELRKRYDGLFENPMPLMMVAQQNTHLYIEFLPLQRAASKLKYLASVESSLGTFLNDVAPEECAEALRRVQI